MIESNGSNCADVFLLAGFGTEAEAKSGVAMSGSTASAIKGILRGTGLKFDETYRAVWLRELPEYRGKNFKRAQAAIQKLDPARHTEMLYEDIKHVQPRVIVPFDDHALYQVTDRIKSEKKPRGRSSWIECYRGSQLYASEAIQSLVPHTIRVIPTYGFRNWIYDGQAKILSHLDFKRIHEARQLNGPIVEDYEIRIINHPGEFEAYLAQAWAQNPEFGTSDIETWGGLPTCVSFCYDGKVGVSVPMWNPSLSKYDMAAFWTLICKAWNSKIPIANQNILYDIGVMDRFGIPLKRVFWDTMLATGIYLPEMPKGLDFLTSLHTDMAYYKDEGKDYDVSTTTKRQATMRYNAKDAIATWRVVRSQINEMLELENSGKARTYSLMVEEMVPTIQIYRQINSTGIRVDDAMRKKKIEKYKALSERNQMTLGSIIGNDKINLNSTQQVGELIYEQLKFPARRKSDPETGKLSWKTDKDTLDDLAMKHGTDNKLGELGRNVILRIIAHRKTKGVLQYLNTGLHKVGNDLFFRCTYNLAGTDTGRTSASKTTDQDFLVPEKAVKGRYRLEFKSLGRSLQTISKHGFNLDEELYDDFESKQIANDMREIFDPGDGYVFVEGDGSQAEARVVALLSEDYKLLEAFDQKPKLHAKTAAMLFDYPAEKITKSEPFIEGIGMPFYDMGKKARHAGNYDLEAFRLSQMTHLPFEICKKLLMKFHDAEPGIRGTFHADIQTCMKREKALSTPLGRYRQFFEDLTPRYFKAGYAFIPQSTIGDHTKFTMWRVAAALEKHYMKGFEFLAEMHDGVLSRVKEELVEEYAVTFKREYERGIDFRHGSLKRDFELIIPAEISFGKNWCKLEDLHV